MKNPGGKMELDSSSSKIFRLAEENHGSNVNFAFQMFRESRQLVDINIIVQGEHFAAHKVILCAASPYFKNQILNIKIPPGCGSPDQNFICIVTDKCSPRQFQYLLDYIYKGEVNVPENELSGVLRAAEDLKIAGLTSKTNGHNNSSNGVATISEAHQRNGNATSVSALGQVSVPNGLTNGHHSSNGTSPDALQPLGNVMPGTNQRRPSGGSNSSGSKTGSGRKKSQPKKLCRTVSPLENPNSHSSPDSIYAPSNYSPKEEDQRPTPSSSRSSHEATEGPMDFSKANRYDQKKFREREDSGEERPLVINETPEPAENKRILPGNGIGAGLPTSTSGIPPTSTDSPISQNLLQSLRQNMPWNIPGAGLPFPPALGEPTRTISESSSGVTHDSERISPENGLQSRRPNHPKLPSMNFPNPQELFQRFQALQDMMANNPQGAPSPSALHPWMNPSLMAASVTAASVMNSPLSSGVMTFANQQQSPLASSPPTTLSPSTSSLGSKGIHNGIGPNGKPSVSCEICGKTLADPSSLYRHRKIHNGEKPHKCQFCGRRFIQRYNMTQHIKTHFKTRGINSLANNPATLANFLTSNQAALENNQLPEDIINSMANENDLSYQRDCNDPNTYDEEMKEDNESINRGEESQEVIDPC